MENSRRDRATELPNWRLANTGRKVLADTVRQLSTVADPLPDPLPTTIPAHHARHVAALQLGALAVRSSGGAMVLISTGYEPEAVGLVRRLIESVLRARAVVDDTSGEQARQWLNGRPRGSAERLAGKYGQGDDIRLLSVAAHADSRALKPVLVNDADGEALEMRPITITPLTPELLYGVAYESTKLAVLLAADLFGRPLDIPPWLSLELQRIKTAAQGADGGQTGSTPRKRKRK